MKIYWKGYAAYDEKHNFLVIVRRMQNNSFCGFLNYPTEEIDCRQLMVNEPTFEEAKKEIENKFKEINDVFEMKNLLPSPEENDKLPSKFLEFLAEFSIHRP